MLSFLRFHLYFYPRPPRGGRRGKLRACGRGEGFLSTPSARRATLWSVTDDPHPTISIHALREEGDAVCQCQILQEQNFYPRPPRGGRQNPSVCDIIGVSFLSTPSARRATCCGAGKEHDVGNFYPRPPRGGRRSAGARRGHTGRFLSTPSARRATRTPL